MPITSMAGDQFEYTPVNNAAEVPCLIEQTDKLMKMVNEMFYHTSELYRFVGAQTAEPCDRAGDTLTDRIGWCYATIQNCCHTMSKIKEFLR